MAHLRLALLAAFCALCLGAYAGISTVLGTSVARGAPVARSGSYHKTGHRTPRRHRHRHQRCAKQSSFRAGSPHRRHRRHRATGCPRRRPGGRHSAPRHHRKSHHLTSGPRRHLPPASNAPRGHSPGAAHSSTCPDADLRPTQEDLSRIRTATICLVNRERVGNGESALQPNTRLEQAAQRHTESMASGDYFEHIGPGGDTPVARMRDAGYLYSTQIGFEVGENIGWATLWLATPRAIVAAWMASPEHRANILDAHFHDTAIGVSPHPPSSLAHGQAGGIYTQDFGVIITG